MDQRLRLSDALMSQSLLPQPHGSETEVRARLGSPNLMGEHFAPTKHTSPTFVETAHARQGFYPRLLYEFKRAQDFLGGPPSIAQGINLAMAAIPGARGRPPRLPMDEASRMARARAMGFYTDMPLYHGTSAEFRAFDPARRGRMTQAESARQGVWLATDPERANWFATASASRLGGHPQVYPLLHRAQRPATLQLSGHESERQVAATLAHTWDQGFDAVLVQLPNRKPTLVVKNEAQLRSPFAAFDPAKRDSRDLLAGLAGLGLFAPLAGSPLVSAAPQRPAR
jgi:hypothetical protein